MLVCLDVGLNTIVSVTYNKLVNAAYAVKLSQKYLFNLVAYLSSYHEKAL